MYIACPSCSTSFSVDGANIGTNGRSVRCFNCSHTWHQYPVVHQTPTTFVPVQYVPPGQFAMPAATAPAPVAAPAPPPAPEPEPEPAPLPEPDPDPIGGADYDEDEEDYLLEPKSSLLGILIKVVIILVVIGGLGAGAIVMRGIVVDLIPSSNIVFELLGMRVPIPGEGLKLQSGSPTRETRDGKEVIVIKGSITNISDVEQQVPEILVRAIDAEKQVVQIQMLKPEKLSLAPGKSQKFTGVFKNLVPTARRLDVTYGAFIVEGGAGEEAPKKDDGQ